MPVEFDPRFLHNDMSDDVNRDMLMEGPSEQRDVPLTNLKTFAAGIIQRDILVDDIIAIFAHCPNIEHLYLPDISERRDVEKIARITVDACPRLSILYLNFDFEDGIGSIALLNNILELMPAQQASKIKFSDTTEPLDPHTMRRLFQRHSSTLRYLDLSRCPTIPSKVLQVVFQECFALEELRTYSSPDSGLCYITLEDAVSVDWVCLRLRCIEIEIGIELSPTFLSKDKAYFRRQPPIVLSEEETRLFGLLEQLYRRLGALMDLEEVDLRATDLGRDRDSTLEIYGIFISRHVEPW
ncbi:hypothetical protein BGZ96_004313 [Linnemannia gamsii]|uniref:RNI-like protein n=1 Tax=Linnemannia gamsii TaxID=64522 RepID=A0ABQ7JIF8_9FUNG|nr:hypothetical protein BGZ96_004313 [Linnemannia gamsii]